MACRLVGGKQLSETFVSDGEIHKEICMQINLWTYLAVEYGIYSSHVNIKIEQQWFI